MAGSRKPGPLGLNPLTHGLNDGTMIRQQSLHPGATGSLATAVVSRDGTPSIPYHTTRTRRRKASQADIQVLRQGSRGPEVEKLQRLINARLTPSPNLAIDGVFSPLVNQAVLLYQKGVSLAADGTVGKQTWYHLLKGDSATAGQVSLPKMPTGTPAGVLEWSLSDKFTEALRRTGPKLPGSMRHEFSALVSPTSLEIIAGTLVVWAGSHAFGVGEVVDIVLLAGGVLFLGLAVFDVAGELGDFLVVTSTATDDKDLDEAASHLAVAIAIMGVAAFIALLAKVARVRGRKSGGAEAPAEPAMTAPKPKKPRPAPKPAEPLPKTVSAIDLRRAENAKLRSGPQFRKDMQKVGVTEEQIANMSAKETPLGFKNREQFQQFKQELDVAMKKDGLNDAEIGMKGTSTTFYSENPGKPLGHHWDADPVNPGDYDLNITSSKMAEQMKTAGVAPSEKYGVFRTRDVEAQYPEVGTFAEKWSQELGRDVNFIGYPKPQARDATEFILRTGK